MATSLTAMLSGFDCEACGEKITVHRRLAGKKVRCNKCQAVVTVPLEKPEPPRAGRSAAAGPSALARKRAATRVPGKTTVKPAAASRPAAPEPSAEAGMPAIRPQPPKVTAAAATPGTGADGSALEQRVGDLEARIRRIEDFLSKPHTLS